MALLVPRNVIFIGSILDIVIDGFYSLRRASMGNVY